MTTYFHIGPFKTGTTAFQTTIWANRDVLRAQGYLYPITGITNSLWGPRHLGLAKDEDHTVFPKLVEELEASADIHSVVISSERMSVKTELLVENITRAKLENVKLVVALRNEADLARSMYLQAVKSAYWKLRMRQKRRNVARAFPGWFKTHSLHFNYHHMLKPWAAAFGAENIIYVPYERVPNFNIVTRICEEIGIDVSKMHATETRSNPSIGPLAHRIWRGGVVFGRPMGTLAMHAGRLIEPHFPKTKSMPVLGFDRAQVSEFFAADRQRAFAELPGFQEAYEKLS